MLCHNNNKGKRKSKLPNATSLSKLITFRVKHTEVCLKPHTNTDLDSQASGRELLVVAFVEAVLSHQRREMLQTVSMSLRG